MIALVLLMQRELAMFSREGRGQAIFLFFFLGVAYDPLHNFPVLSCRSYIPHTQAGLGLGLG